MTPALRWLVLEGVVPIFGAGVLFFVLGVGKWVVTPNKKAFTYNWVDAVDPIGWLYGGTVIAVTAAVKSWGHPDSTGTTVWCSVGAVGCLIILICAFHAKADDGGWAPPTEMSVVSGILVIVILAAGYRVNSESPAEVQPHEQSRPSTPTPQAPAAPSPAAGVRGKA